jgi:hypothetical protein
MTSSEGSRTDKDRDSADGRRVYPRASSLAALSGAHPDALRALYSGGRATDPAELGDAPRGDILALGGATELFLVTRSLVRLVSLFPWEGKAFDHGGNSGKNLLLGRQLVRFHAEIAASALDSKPTLVLSYDVADHKNPWPIRALTDELRTVGDGIAVGPVLFHGGRGSASAGSASPRLLLWFGLEIR